ncbi:MAG: extracellular solute-binding protein [Gemmatimonadota bacterium]|nr:extracellular solute-binding protein [Gemmatimonadota bacterium]
MIRTVIPCIALLSLVACRGADVSKRDTLVIFEAASLSAPMRPLLDTFSRRTGATVLEEHGASLELARRITDLHRVPDVVALADHEVFPELLIPSAASWYATFARNRMVVAFTDRSRHASEITPDNWRSITLRPDVALGRTDPVLAPAGYRALLAYQLAESFYHEPGLAKRLESQTPPRLIRGNASELAALLSAGELDYIIEYESLARSQHFRIVHLPPEIDLGDQSRAAEYAKAQVAVTSARGTTMRRGAPILYGISVPDHAPHGDIGLRFVQFLLGADGRSMLRSALVDALDSPAFVGRVPSALATTRAP